jgi:hypothetical protein
MNFAKSRIIVRLLLCACVGVVAAGAQTPSSNPTKEKSLPHHASGPFDVKITPDPFAEKAVDSTLGRMMIDKQYHGDLEASGKGEMLTVSTAEKGSGVYVAVERVSGALQGRKGSFALHHTGVMRRSVPELKVMVVPDSGTEELAGIAGTMTIHIAAGKHSYELEYTLPEKQ